MVYEIIKKKTKKGWHVYWNNRKVYEHYGRDAEFFAATFADALERGITGSYDALFANSRIQIEGVYYEPPERY
jgi:hypothetical protein